MVCKMFTTVHSSGEGVNSSKNLVHIVVECLKRVSQTIPAFAFEYIPSNLFCKGIQKHTADVYRLERVKMERQKVITRSRTYCSNRLNILQISSFEPLFYMQMHIQ